MLSNLDNEVIFKKAFTNKVVFTQFVKDVVGIDIDVDKIETEKKFDEKLGYIDIKFDIFAESKDHRVIVEIQKVEYDYNFDRFMNYFLSAIIDQQRSSKKYKINQTVYTIVVLTAPYKIKTLDGDFIQDEFMLTKLNPQNLLGEEKKIFGHELYFLNSYYRKDNTPNRYKDWLDLIYESINNPDNPKINISNQGIKKASELIDKDMLTNEERTLMKEYEGRKVVLRNEREEGLKEGVEIGKNDGLKEKSEQVIINGNKKGFSNQDLSELTGLSVNEVEEIINKTRQEEKE
jgi:predicted transposase/invertase (TIGR01784 family)